MIKTSTRYTTAGLLNVIAQLEAWRESTEESLDNENSRDYPNEERADKYQTRLDALQDAIDALEGIE